MEAMKHDCSEANRGTVRTCAVVWRGTARVEVRGVSRQLHVEACKVGAHNTWRRSVGEGGAVR